MILKGLIPASLCVIKKAGYPPQAMGIDLFTEMKNYVAYFLKIGYSILATYYILYVGTQQEERYGKVISREKQVFG